MFKLFFLLVALASPSFQQREAAMVALRPITSNHIDLLEKVASNSKDVEQVRRCRILLSLPRYQRVWFGLRNGDGSAALDIDCGPRKGFSKVLCVDGKLPEQVKVEWTRKEISGTLRITLIAIYSLTNCNGKDEYWYDGSVPIY